jgi:hypothetical protein
MIIIKNSQLNNDTVVALNKLIDMDINAKLAFKLMRIIKEVSSLLEDKVKLEKKIFDKWLERDANGEAVPARNENGEIIEGAVKLKDGDAFNMEMSELLSIENEIGYEAVDFEELNLETAKIKDLMKIDFLFK